MSGPVSVRFDDREWRRGFEALGKRFPAAARRSLRRAGTTGKTLVARAIRDDMGLKISTIKGQIRMRVKDASVELEVTGGRIPLIEFTAKGPEPSRGRGRGVSYRIGRKRTRIGNAFIATMRSGHRGVFKRTGPKRLPITELHGPSIVRVFSRKMPTVIPDVQESLFKNLRHEFARAAGGR